MAISSTLNPQAILGSNVGKITPEAYLSSSGILESSNLIGAANNIVRFQSQSVRPIDTSAIVNNTIANISNNITNQVQTMNLEVVKSLKNTVNDVTRDYEKRIKELDSSKPTSLLQKFIDVYRESISFLNSFSDLRTIQRLQNNLKALQTSFAESFNVAKIIREVIVKIVKQLSNLPTASSSGGGGFKIDVDLPSGGSAVKRTAPRGIGNVGKAVALGAGAFGLGALGAGTVNALSGSEQLQPTPQTPYIPEDFNSKFSQIVDRFSKAIQDLISGIQKSSKESEVRSTSGGGSPSSPMQPSGSPGTSTPISGDTPSEIKAVMGAISSPESGGNYEAMYPGTTLPGATKMTISEVARKATGPVGRYQHKPQFLIERARQVGLDPDKDAFSPENQDKITRGHIVGLLGGDESKLVEKLRRDPLYAKKRLEGTQYTGLQKYTDASYLEKYKSEMSKYDGQVQTPSSKDRSSKLDVSGTAIPSVQGLSGISAVSAAPARSTAQQQIAQKVSQPAVPQVQTLTLPPQVMDVSSQKSSGSVVPSQTPPINGSSNITLLPTGNSDNFLVLYSRLIYNIVDG